MNTSVARENFSVHNEMEVWGGVECTVNRVGDRYFNQIEFSGHLRREDDLERFAALGLRTLRFPILWETTAPDSLEKFDWRWSDRGLTKLRELGIRPIVGLLHHGSGPCYTSLVDPEFPTKLARFAAAVAERYPWINMYTPVNEPLTTARFSALYGHWYPHATDEQSFTTALLNEIRATILAMRAIRRVNPQAQLVQTEDLGCTFSTPHLQYQAEFENERRWITWDLLAGRVLPGTRMWQHLLWAGVRPNDLEFFVNEKCPADFIGINYYVTSERYLDHKIDMYPAELHGGNGREHYADDAAVRARVEGLAGAQIVITEAFNRYRMPIALTEVHLGCAIDEQLRWADEMWSAAQSARADGADVRGVTAWALLGSFDWDSLVTQRRNRYEPGAFDVSLGQPRQTELGAMWSAFARGKQFDHPALSSSGWWRQPERLRFSALATAA